MILVRILENEKEVKKSMMVTARYEVSTNVHHSEVANDQHIINTSNVARQTLQ